MSHESNVTTDALFSWTGGCWTATAWRGGWARSQTQHRFAGCCTGPCSAAAPGQLLDIINTPLGTGLSCTSPRLPKQQEKAFFICCIIVYNKSYQFQWPKGKFKSCVGFKHQHSLGSSWYLFSKSKERKYIHNSRKWRAGVPYLLMLSMSA